MLIQQRPRAAHRAQLSATSLAVTLACAPAVLPSRARSRCATDRINGAYYYGKLVYRF
jgi:hypothetical protein